MNKKFFLLQIVIVIVFTIFYAFTLNPELASMNLTIFGFLEWISKLQGIPLIPESTRSNMTYILPLLIMGIFIICWVEERLSDKKETMSYMLEEMT